MRVGCERTVFRFLAAAYGRLNTTWTLPMIVGWPIAKELLMTGRHVQPEEAYRLGLLNHLVPADQVMEKAMEIAATIAENHPDSVQGVKQLLVEDVGLPWQEMWEREIDYMNTRVSHVGVEDAFKEFISRRGR
jgi:enoyl-CoA hydratase/carnithine racemase